MPAMRLPAASYEASGRLFTLSCKGCITGKVTAPTYQITLNTLHDVLLLSKFRICRIFQAPPWCQDVAVAYNRAQSAVKNLPASPQVYHILHAFASKAMSYFGI